VTPVVFIGSGLVTIASPILHLVLALIDIVDRKQWRFSRMGGLGIALCVTEFFGLIAAFVLWVASGFGLWIKSPRFQRIHNRVFGWWLELVTRALRFYLGFEFEMPVTERISGPILTFARHAGPGDAFLLARTVIRDYRRQLRMLGTHKLLWDPFMNHMMLRLPNVFLEQNSSDAAADLAAITEMCATMGDDGVAIIFPEGGNWTPGRWEGAISSLHMGGRVEHANRAANMPNVLPPKSSGAAAALDARDDMTVVFVVHAGLADLHSLAEIWRNVPLRRTVQATYWSVPRDEIPEDRGELSTWLFDHWALLDQWIAETRPSIFGHDS
jgi:1-acyl-sn-glycerol-3-phosphate acyltransferase